MKYSINCMCFVSEMPPCLEDCLFTDPCADSTCYSSCNQCQKTYMSEAICGSFSYSYEASYACGDISYSYDLWRWSYSFGPFIHA